MPAIPIELLTLYKHWEKYTKLPAYFEDEGYKIELNSQVKANYWAYAEERTKIWESKQANQPVPWTEDPVLQQYKFLNVYRELDKQTIIWHKLLQPLTADFDLWLLNIMYCRFICRPETIEQTGLLSFNLKENLAKKRIFDDMPSPKNGVAYVFPVSLINKLGYRDRSEFYFLHLPKVARQCAEKILTIQDGGVTETVESLLPIFGCNMRFHLTEVLIDVAYQYPEIIDLYKPFYIGPGSLPTMQRLNPRENPSKVCLALVVSQPTKTFPYLEFNGQKVYFTAEGCEGLGCEFRKYTNLSGGKGRVRKYAASKANPGDESQESLF